MKRDVTELKKLFLEVMKNPGAPVHNPSFFADVNELQPAETGSQIMMTSHAPSAQSVLMHNDIHEHVEVEESLNIMDKERELIIKALKKHKGKRKDAALDLGISERTLYRKLKEYDIDQ